MVDFSHFSDPSLASFKKLMKTTSTIRTLLVWNPGAQSPDTIRKIVKSNFSLRVVISMYPEEDRQLLDFYANRNKQMAQWRERPKTLVPQLIPKVLHVASQGHPSVLFQSLLAIAGDLDTVKRKRNRKGPVHLKPS